MATGSFFSELFAQPTWTLDPFGQEKKPEKFSEKKLGSEKTGEKKFTPFRRFMQNNISRYNYFFNANLKLVSVLDRAKMAQEEDYTKLLPFYPFSLETTSGEKVELDSVIYKASAGILLHDLRSDWVDDLYLLIGKAFFYRKDFDSAALTFQFINYNLFPRSKQEEDSRVIGGNAAASGSMLSISDPENRTFVQKTFKKLPCRNDALVWIARAYTDAGEYGEASGMINILFQDINLPKRLKGSLNEINAYWYYKQEIYDSAAVYLEKAIPTAPTKLDRVRWQYLLGQLYEMAGDYGKASQYYLKSAKKTIDPLMDIHAHLNDAKMASGKGDLSQLDDNILRLLKMAKKDKYHAYRDIIYYSTGELAMKKPDTALAFGYFLKSLKFNEENVAYRNKAFLQLANLSYDSRNYTMAAAYYDSIDIEDISVEQDTGYINDRKSVLSRITSLISIIDREDSLQLIARMPPSERDAFIKKLSRKLRAQSGVKEEDIDTRGNIAFSNKSNEPVDLFGASSKGDWYFYNTNLRSKGFNDFQGKWGKRANLDNWRRSSSVGAALSNIDANIDVDAPASDKDSAKAASTGLVPGSYDALMADLPVKANQLDSSNARIASALLDMAAIFRNELQDYQEAIRIYEEYLSRFTGSKREGEVYTGLYFCYTKLGETAMAEKYKKLILENFAGSKYEKSILNPNANTASLKDAEESAKYQVVYDLFISGRFEEALAAKNAAGNLLDNSYWTPQLLYLEAVYHVRQRNDSAAIRVLDDIITLYPESSLREKAETLKDVVSRREEIETYLNSLDVTRVPDDKIIVPDDRKRTAPAGQNNAASVNSISPSQSAVNTNVAGDTSRATTAASANGFIMKPEMPHIVVMVLDKVDPVYITEVKNALTRFNRDKYRTKQIAINKDALDANRSLLLFEIFDDANMAVGYYDNVKKNIPAYISWLQASKYSFLIITRDNFQLLKSGKDISAYKSLLNNLFPNKF